MESLFACENKHADYIQSYYYNEKFRYLLNKKDYEKAQAAELASKENLQNHFELDSNLGIVFNLLSKNEESEKSFNEALSSIGKNLPENSPEKNQALFMAYFNRGVFFQSQSKVDKALKDYQKALDINPTSMETKTNIELLIQKQKEDQKKQSQNQSDQKKKDPQNQDQGQTPQKDNKEDIKNDPKDNKDNDKKNDKPDDKKDNKKDKEGSAKEDRSQTPKYQPRPFKGDQLSEGDVKKILGELSQQDKKIRSQFDKKEKEESGKDGRNEKDW